MDRKHQLNIKKVQSTIEELNSLQLESVSRELETRRQQLVHRLQNLSIIMNAPRLFERSAKALLKDFKEWRDELDVLLRGGAMEV